MLTIGRFDIVSVVTGTFRLDGGAMFGVVPKVLWGPHEDVDDDNRILLSTRSLIAVSHDRKTAIVVDTGNGTKWPPEEARRFAIDPDGDAISRALRDQFALSTSDVTDIIVTHLHFDHNGGLTEWAGEPGGETRLCFPSARHWIHRRHWEYAYRPTEKDRASFLDRDIGILKSTERLHWVDGVEPASPWGEVRFFVSDGHTPAQLLPIFDDGRTSLMHVGDVFPTSSHLRPAWVMAYDLEPLKTIDEKKRILSWCREKGLRLAFPHDARLGAAEIEFSNSRPIVTRTVLP